MGKKASEIISMDVQEVITMLNRAYADEWLAYTQYWLDAKLCVGPMRGEIAGEFQEHAQEELDHAERIAKRIISLGGTPLTSPKYWFNQTICGYGEPTKTDVCSLLGQNVAAERCAIGVYKHIMDVTPTADPVTYHLALEILEDELEHEEDLETLRQDLSCIIKACQLK